MAIYGQFKREVIARPVPRAGATATRRGHRRGRPSRPTSPTRDEEAMPVAAVVGAGPGLGLSVARVFGANGYDVALISSRRATLDALVRELRSAGVTAAGFAADVADHDRLAVALLEAQEVLGPIDVVEFSPYAGLDLAQPADVTVEALRAQMDVQLYGAVTTVRAVLPGMLERGAGTLLFTMGGGSIEPYPMLATLNPPQGALRNWVKNLHNTLGERGVQAATVVVNAAITTQTPEHPHVHPGAVAQVHWDLHTDRARFEQVIGPV
jgi:NADP-dependent 3-hydroxy acid dehydrogenase YdfG